MLKDYIRLARHLEKTLKEFSIIIGASCYSFNGAFRVYTWETYRDETKENLCYSLAWLGMLLEEHPNGIVVDRNNKGTIIRELLEELLKETLEEK